MSDRALTLATLGLISGSALTVASLGLIQGDYVAPPTTPAPVYFEADGYTYARRIKELRDADLIRDDEDLLVILQAILDSGVMDG